MSLPHTQVTEYLNHQHSVQPNTKASVLRSKYDANLKLGPLGVFRGLQIPVAISKSNVETWLKLWGSSETEPKLNFYRLVEFRKLLGLCSCNNQRGALVVANLENCTTDVQCFRLCFTGRFEQIGHWRRTLFI